MCVQSGLRLNLMFFGVFLVLFFYIEWALIRMRKVFILKLWQILTMKMRLIFETLVQNIRIKVEKKLI